MNYDEEVHQNHAIKVHSTLFSKLINDVLCHYSKIVNENTYNKAKVDHLTTLIANNVWNPVWEELQSHVEKSIFRQNYTDNDLEATWNKL